MQELFLFPNYKAKNNYLKDKFNNYTLDITNYQTLHQYYKNSIDNFFEKYKIEYEVQKIDESIAVINIHNILFQYKEKYKNSLIAKQNINYELAYTLYKLIEEITLAKFYNFKLDDYKNLEEINNIINLYKKYNRENNLLDEFDIFELFIEYIKNKKLNFFNNYNSITIYNFEKIPPLHLIFLENIKKHYNINIKVIMPYDMKKHFNNYKSFYQGIDNIDNFDINKNSDFAKALLKENNNINQYKDKIKFISGFGAKQEADTVIDEIIKLIEKGVNPYDIGIIFSDIQLYSDIISNRLKECKIKFNERRANFIWKVPIIPVLTSIFLILDKYDGEIDTDALIKILSSSYIKNLDKINPYNIRDMIYSSDDEIFSKMSFKDFKYKIAKKFEENNASKSIIDFLDLLNELVSKKTYKEIGLSYIKILKFLKIGNIFEDDTYKDKDEYFYRDNEALALFINIIIDIAYTNTENIKISHFDFHSALNTILRDKSIGEYNSRDISVTVSNLYDARGLRFKYLFILGMNNNFINRKPNLFFIGSKLREEINKKNKKIAFNTQSYLSDINYALFLNILSLCYDDSNIYFAFRFKDEKGNLEIPFYYLEDLYRELYNDDFKFESLEKNGLIYRKEYIQKQDNIHTDKENLMSLFLYNDIAYNIENINDIIDTVYHKSNKNMHHNFNNKNEEIKNFFLNIFKEKVSVTTLQSVMECPAKFFYSALYSKESAKSKMQSINYMDRGKAYHQFFQDFYKEVKNRYGSHLKESEFNNYCNIANEVIENHINNLINIYSEKDLEEKYKLEYEYDYSVIKEEALNIMSSFIKKEIEQNKIKEDEGFYYIPSYFEKYIGGKYEEDFIIYQNKDLSIKIKGIADRIDFSYYDEENKNINGIRIVDYKSSYKKEEPYGETQKDIIKETIRIYFQPILYLKFILNKYIQNSVAEKIKHLEVVFTVYKEKDVINESQQINQSYNDRDMLLSICGYIESEYNLNNYFDEIFDKILEGELIYIPNSANCDNCYNFSYCEKSYKKDDYEKYDYEKHNNEE
ncbi:PD-(D/E)XK nuclease family protein [uncultured Brachyspira sp.]|uniref:PD-(D/E)XK nuclease family protein n=2 Tax=uncultured Brachyspira sp. TaxID=221953 RepID=UPI0025E6D4B5|nr:PD-(D/E)XK nuclease family protein [uncultured Brachyspira sp.]